MKILAIQNRMGIGDTVIFLPYIQAISKKYNTPISILVKKNSKADQFLDQTKYIDQIIFLERDNQKKERHDGILGVFRLVQDLKKYNFEKVFIFNSSLRFNLVARLSGIKQIYQYPLFKKNNQHITNPAIDLIKKNLKVEINNVTEIQINTNLIDNAKLEFSIKEDDLNILLGVGGSGPTKRIPSKTFLSVIEKIDKIKKCKFF